MAGTDFTRRGGRFQDLTGQTFDRLTVVEWVGTRKGKTLWRCRCVCGGETVVMAGNLKTNQTTSCGCRARENRLGRNNPNFMDLTGRTFNRLTVLEYAEAKKGNGFWRCRCVCGNEAVVMTERLTGGGTKSCGCRYRETIQGVPWEERLWPRIRKTEGCWEWKGTRSRGSKGYGVIGLGPGAGNAFVHRLVYELLVGPVPDGLCVLHHCDNPPCCRPDHLFLGTRGDNAEDRHAKGRDYRGPRPWATKLTAEQVAAIWREYRASGIGHKRLAKKHGVSASAVRHILRGQTWRHVTGPLEGEVCGPQAGGSGF
jgi:hypothetical protein